jgi:glycine/serine hydroxymethyltransferase
MREIAEMIADCLERKVEVETIKARVHALCAKFPLYE